MYLDTTWNFVWRSILSGVLIALASYAFIVCPNRYVGSFLFAYGLLTIILKDYLLYTGRVGNWEPKLQDTIVLLKMFILNGIGAYAFGFLLTFTRGDISAVEGILTPKLTDTYYSIFILAIGCGAMMHLAVYNYKTGKHPIYVIMPIMFFILAGFEHCVANCAYFALGKVPFTWELLIRLTIMVIGNAVGSLIFTKIVPKLC